MARKILIEDVFDEKFALYSELLYRICMVYLKNHSAVDDIIQDTFISLLYKSPIFYSPEHERNWVVRVAINLCKDSLKRHSYRTSSPLEEQLVPCVPADINETLLLVQGLPEKYRSVILLHYIEGFSVKEVSKILNVGVSAVKMRLKRGREILKLEMEDENLEQRQFG